MSCALEHHGKKTSGGLSFVWLYGAVSAHELKNQWQSQWRYAIAVGLLSPAAYLLVLFALQSAPLTYVAPIREISMLIGTILGAKLLKEAIHTSQIVGASMRLIGVAALAIA